MNEFPWPLLVFIAFALAFTEVVGRVYSARRAATR